MGIICETCGRDIDALGQDNMGVGAPLCEDCWNGQKRLAVQDRSLQNLHRENEHLRSENKALADNLAEVGRKLADARQRLRSDGPADCKRLRREVEAAYEVSRERALALTKLDECEMWLGRCEPKETAAPTLKGAAQEAAMPCLKDDEVRGFAMPDVNVGGEGRGNGREVGQEPARGHAAGPADGGEVAMEQTKKKRRPSIEVRCPACRMREIWHHLPKGGDRCRWCGHLFEDYTYRKVGPGAKEDAR